jgi:hypothetical protein
MGASETNAYHTVNDVMPAWARELRDGLNVLRQEVSVLKGLVNNTATELKGLVNGVKDDVRLLRVALDQEAAKVSSLCWRICPSSQNISL